MTDLADRVHKLMLRSGFQDRDTQETLLEAYKALTAQQDGAWQPIETAPKDGTKVLLVEDDQPSEVCTGWWMEGAWRDWGDIGCNGQEDYAPTHWMPLPFGPTAHEQGAGS